MTSVVCEMGDAPQPRKHLGLMQLLFLNAVVCGTEFCASAGFTYIPPMLLKASFSEQYMTFILGVGPLIGMFVVPLIGQWSDRCTSKYGRRRPFILGISIIIIISLVLIPYGEALSIYAFHSLSMGKYVGVICLATGVILLDFSSQALLNPCEAMLTDACRNTTQQEQCFQMYSVMVSLGGCIGYLVTALNWNKTTVGEMFGSQEKSAFSLLVVFFTITLFITLNVVEEIPHLEEGCEQTAVVGNGVDPGYETEGSTDGNDDLQTDDATVCLTPTKKKQSRSSGAQEVMNFKHCHGIIRRKLFNLSRFQPVFELVASRIYHRLPRFLQRICDLPFTLKILASADFFCWTAIFSFNFFFSDFVGQFVYKGNPNSPEGSMELLLYDEGVRMGSWGLFLHCITSGVFAMVMDRFTDRYGTRKIFLCGMVSFTLVMVCMLLAKDSVVLVTIMACLTGLGYATLTTIPYSMMALYLEDPQLFFYEHYQVPNTKSQPTEGAAGNLAVLDSSYFFSQVFLSAFMGYFLHCVGSVQAYIIFAAIFGVLGCFCVSKSIFTRQEMIHHIRNSRRTNNN